MWMPKQGLAQPMPLFISSRTAATFELRLEIGVGAGAKSVTAREKEALRKLRVKFSRA